VTTDEPETWTYRDGFCNGMGWALTAMRSRLKAGQSTSRALAALREFWISDLSAWADEGDGECPPVPAYAGNEERRNGQTY
jgi:hypothetical protein